MANASTTPPACTNIWRLVTSENDAVYGGDQHLAIIDASRGDQIIADIETGPNQHEHAHLMVAAPDLARAGELLADQLAGHVIRDECEEPETTEAFNAWHQALIKAKLR